MTVVGERIALKEGHAKATGIQKFVSDFGITGGLWMKILRSPYAHARIKSIDVSKAAALPCVGAVNT